jgi:tetratricopeptide (TPR) repeat protein
MLLIKERDARREADRLRRQAETRLKLSQAITYLSWGQNSEANALVSEVSVPELKVEYPTLSRGLGDWHGSHGRWREAADQFSLLMQVVQPDDWDTATLDYLRLGPALIEAGDMAGYERFREAAVAHYTGTVNPIAAERVVKISLLQPADGRLLGLLQPLGEVAAASLDGDGARIAGPSLSAWRSFSLALWELRRGRFEKALEWCNRSLEYQRSNVPRESNVQLVAAMARLAQGQTGQAVAEMTDCRSRIEDQFASGLQVGDGGQGFWFDWVFARILLREAEMLAGQMRIEAAPPR